MTVQFWEVGGCVRDEIMGVKPHDIDFTVVAPSFEFMRDRIAQAGMKIVQEKPEFGTVRAVAREPFMGHSGGLDFVWARVDGPSSDGRRPDWTRPGNLQEDLARRDFTVNAIAKDEQGNLIDPYNGIEDIKRRIIRAVGNPQDRLTEDALRGLRALRFAITKGFYIEPTLFSFMQTENFADMLDSVSKERQREEVEKMFAANTMLSLRTFNNFANIAEVVFSDGLRLSATMKES